MQAAYTVRRNANAAVNPAAAASKTVDVPANGRATVEFQSLDVPYGFTRCEVRIDSADTFSADDVSQFAVERSDPRRALFVSDAADSRSPLYFKSALASAEQVAFAVDTVSAGQASSMPLPKYAFVVLSDLISVPAALENDLVKYVQAGGSVWIAEGAAAAHAARIPVFSGSVVDSRDYARTGDHYANVGEADPSHPSLANADRWSGVKFYFAVKVDPGDGRVIARRSV